MSIYFINFFWIYYIAHHGEVSGQAADIWSMGVTLHCLAFGCLPFEKDNILDLYDSIKNDE